VPLPDRCSIRIGPVHVYFTLPVARNGNRTPKGTYAQMIMSAFEKGGESALSKEDIIKFCLEQNPEYTDPVRKRQLQTSMNDQLNKRAFKGTDGRWTLLPPSQSFG